MSQTHRLAAILAADVAGYSRLMGADEEGASERLKRMTSFAPRMRRPARGRGAGGVTDASRHRDWGDASGQEVVRSQQPD
ncbi:MAG: hypothetical protein JOY71_23705 [Acetobacteraceae bacterium]|nr:hypothetical protein [Acetobacteraceae bacterium]